MDKSFALAFELTSDPAKARAGFEATRKALLTTYSDAKAEVAKLNEKLVESQAKAQAMAVAMRESGPPTKAMVADFAKVRASVNAAQAAVEAKTVALQKARQAARENAESIAAATRAERELTASTQARVQAAALAARPQAIAASMSVVGLQSRSAILADIANTNRAVASLKANGAAAQDIARAAQAAQLRIAALAAELNGTTGAANASGSAMAGTAHRMAAMAAAALAAREAIQLLKGSVSTGVEFDSLKTQFSFGVGGDVRKAAQEMDYAREMSQRLGLELVGTTRAYGKLMAASRGTTLQGEATRDIFKAVASAGAVMGLTAEEQSGALLAISQMMSKGTVSAEELRGQLAERLPSAFETAARAMRMTQADFMKLLESGKLTAAEFLPRFATELQKSVEADLPKAEASARAGLQRLENAFTEFKLRIANSGLLDKVAEQVERVLKQLENMDKSGELKKLAEGFAEAFGGAIKFMADAAIFAERFAEVLGPLAKALAAVMVGGRALALLGSAAPGLAATGTAAVSAAVGVGRLAMALRLLAGLTIGGAILFGASALIEWGAEASEARAKAAALDAELRKSIDSHEEHAGAAMRDAEGLKEFGDEAFTAYQQAIEGARDYAAAKAEDLSRSNTDGSLSDDIAYYVRQKMAYDAYLETIIKGEQARRDQVRLTGRVLELEAKREAILNGEVKKSKADALKEEIKSYEKLIDSIKKTREELAKEGEESLKKAAEFRAAGGDKRQSAADKATALREQGLTEEERQAADARRAADAQSEGNIAALRASLAQKEGRTRDFEKYSREAEKFLDRAMQFAEKAGDANLVEEIGGQQGDLEDVRARAAEKQAADAAAKGAALIDQLATAEAKLKELQDEAATIEVNAEITEAINALSEVESRLAALQDKTVTVTINTVDVSASGIAETLAGTEDLPTRAYGGPLPGRAPHDRADNMLYWGTPGEWVIQRPSVRYYGSAFMAALNAKKLPKYGYGGALGNLRIPSVSPSQATASQSSSTPINLYLDGHRMPVTASRDVASSMKVIFSREALKRGGKR